MRMEETQLLKECLLVEEREVMKKVVDVAGLVEGDMVVTRWEEKVEKGERTENPAVHCIMDQGSLLGGFQEGAVAEQFCLISRASH